MSVDQTTHVLCLFLRDAVANDTDGANARARLRGLRPLTDQADAPPGAAEVRFDACIDTIGKSIIEHVQYVQLSPDHEEVALELSRIIATDIRAVTGALGASIANAVAILDPEFRTTVRAKMATQMDLGAGRKLSYLDSVLRSVTTVEALDAFSVVLMDEAPESEATAALRHTLLAARMALSAASGSAADSTPQARPRRSMGL